MPAGAIRSADDNMHGDGNTTDVQLTEQETPGGSIAERRKHSRHRYIERPYSEKKNGMWFTTMTYEISLGGLSAATTTELMIGEKMSLSPSRINVWRLLCAPSKTRCMVLNLYE
jgi:hypothetical protein